MIHSHWIQSDPEGTGWSFLWNKIWTGLKNLIVFKHLFWPTIYFDQKLFGNLKCNWPNNLLSHKFGFTQKIIEHNILRAPNFFWGYNFFEPKFASTHPWSKTFLIINLLTKKYWLHSNFWPNIFDQKWFWPAIFFFQKWNISTKRFCCFET